MTIAGVLLAAGAGSRFDAATHKLLASVGGAPVLSLALEALMAADLDEVVVVTGAANVDHLLTDGVSQVHNDRWAEGQASSLQAAVAHCRAAGHEAFVVGLGDQPGILTETWNRLARTDAPIAIATYDGVRGNPVRLSVEVWDLLPVDGDVGARPLIASRPELVTAVVCDGRPDDIDTTEDLRRWN
jgi:molybdenum cofactor cytidylyltransferase